LFSQAQGELKTAYLLENDNGKDEWQCRYNRGTTNLYKSYYGKKQK